MNLSRVTSLIVGLALAIALTSCTSSNREQAKEKADQDLQKATAEAKKAGSEIKADAKDLSRRVDDAVQPDQQSASEKLSKVEAAAKSGVAQTGIKLDHAALLAKVKTKLISDAGLGTLANVNVDADGSIVTLSGTVVSESQKQAAQIAASQVDGVTKVQNNLTVQP